MKPSTSERNLVTPQQAEFGSDPDVLTKGRSGIYNGVYGTRVVEPDWKQEIKNMLEEPLFKEEPLQGIKGYDKRVAQLLEAGDKEGAYVQLRLNQLDKVLDGVKGEPFLEGMYGNELKEQEQLSRLQRKPWEENSGLRKLDDFMEALGYTTDVVEPGVQLRKLYYDVAVGEKEQQKTPKIDLINEASHNKEKRIFDKVFGKRWRYVAKINPLSMAGILGNAYELVRTFQEYGVGEELAVEATSCVLDMGCEVAERAAIAYILADITANKTPIKIGVAKALGVMTVSQAMQAYGTELIASKIITGEWEDFLQETEFMDEIMNQYLEEQNEN